LALVVLLLGALYIALAAALAWWTLEPINRVAGRLQLSTRFALTDFVALMIMLQVPLAVAGRAIDSSRDAENAPYWIMLGLASLLAIVLWAAAVSVVSRAGITRIWQRLCVIVLLVPGTLGLIVAWPIVLTILVSLLAANSWQTREIALDALTALALLGLTILFRRLSFWVLVGSPGETLLGSLASGPRFTKSPATIPATTKHLDL
jgi:hypothetical protein